MHFQNSSKGRKNGLVVEKCELIDINSTSDSTMTFLDFSTLEKLESVIQIDASIPLEPVIYSGALFTLQFPSMHLHPVGITHSIFDTVDSTPCVILTKCLNGSGASASPPVK